MLLQHALLINLGRVGPEEEGGVGVPLEARSLASSIKPATQHHRTSMDWTLELGLWEQKSNRAAARHRIVYQPYILVKE